MKRREGQVEKALAIYYLPGDEVPQMICGPTVVIHHLLDGAQLQQGFVFAPFEQSAAHPLLLIKAEECVRGEVAIEEKLHYCKIGLAPNEFLCEDQLTKQDFLCAVETCVTKIKQSEILSKVVLSRPLVQKMPDDFSPWNTLKSLHQAMPNAFCFLVNIPHHGVWMGATPERLLEVKDGIAQTNALAGTLALDAANAWSEKEIDEQQIVTDYIARHLAKAKIHKYTQKGPHTISSGSVKHLKTVFDFEVENDLQIAEVVKHLHPTPAVCGMPKAESLSEINALEGYSRAYYTGYLGAVGLEGETRLFVNLRSMQLGLNVACLYIGAGITAGSDPHKEWDETEVKAQTLLSVICEKKEKTSSHDVSCL